MSKQLPPNLNVLLANYQQMSREIADSQQLTERLLMSKIHDVVQENDRLRTENECLRAFVLPTN